VIRERWPQFLYGFYPNHLLWRPNLTFVLLFVALAPILFTQLPRKMLWLSALFPPVAFFLLWGGSFWGPVVAMLGFVVGWAAWRIAVPLTGAVVAAGSGVVAAALYWLFIDLPLVAIMDAAIPLAIEEVRSDKFGGFVLAITIGVAAIALSLPLGILLALGGSRTCS
jgi:general L-amino acid transport system permease protein